MLRTKTIRLLGLLTLVAFAAHADEEFEKPDVSKLPPPAAKAGLTYDTDVKPIIENSCVECHGGEKPKGKYRIGTREGMIKGKPGKPAVIVPGKSEDSPVIWFTSDLVEDMEMPPLDKRDKFPALTKEQVGILRAWIDQGAK